MKINLLSSKIYNRIAAGEVVERPFSVVKELVENSIDAGATEIEIENGGISLIKITDNGFGIEKSELKKALLPHATSKISSITDLDNICSLGFRGEALASIASVSKVNIKSKPKAQTIGAEIFAEGGDISLISDCATTEGTIITVKNLFYNTPVREKFLHSERSEENEISSTVARFILGNPNISFRYVADGKTIFQSFGDGFESAMICIYGVNVIKDCFYIDTEKNGIKITGYLGKHYFTKGNRSYQTVFINGRHVVNQTVSSSIMNAYSAYLMKRQYPFYVLNISLPTEIVDVNVHPNKLDVRFANNQIVYGSIYSVVSKVLDGSKEALNIVTNDSSENKTNINENQNDYAKHNLEITFNNTAQKRDYNKLVFKDSGTAGIDFENIKIEEKQEVVDIFAENKAYLESLNKKKQEENAPILETIIQEKVKIDREFIYIGQVLNTYLVFEDGLDLYLADQHAAHERILFDQLNESLKNSDIVKQPLLLPFILNVNSQEYSFLMDKEKTLKSLGIEIEEFGRNAFKISAIPSFLTEINLQKFFNDVLGDLDELKTLTVNDLLMQKLAQKACKSAIKAGDKLSDLEIKVLMAKLKEDIGLKCPHGRPVAIKISRTEIDKWFKRIV